MLYVGGEFNTSLNKDLELIVEKFNQSKISFDSKNIGYILFGLV